MTPPSDEALAWAREMASRIGDSHERALVTQVIETVTEGRRLPSWGVMTPLMRSAALALQGKTRPWEEPDITDEAIEKFRADCGAVHNVPLAMLCGKALRGDTEARDRVAVILARAGQENGS